MSLLVPIVLASFVLFQVLDVDVGKPKIAKKEEVTTSEIKISEEESSEITNEVVVNEPKQEVKVDEAEVKIVEPVEPKEEVVEAKEEVEVVEPKEEVKAEETDKQISSDQNSETVTQDVNSLTENNSDSGTNWLIIALYIFLGLFLLATASYYFSNRTKNNQKSTINEESTSSNEESSDQNINIPSEENVQNPVETGANVIDQTNTQEEDNQDNKNN
jgi:hypothetical protein